MAQLRRSWGAQRVLPRVARCSQPWAGGQNPVGILPPSRHSVLAVTDPLEKYSSPALDLGRQRRETSLWIFHHYRFGIYHSDYGFKHRRFFKDGQGNLVTPH